MAREVEGGIQKEKSWGGVGEGSREKREFLSEEETEGELRKKRKGSRTNTSQRRREREREMKYEQRLTTAATLILDGDARAEDAPVNCREFGVTATLKPHQVEGVSWLIRSIFSPKFHGIMQLLMKHKDLKILLVFYIMSSKNGFSCQDGY